MLLLLCACGFILTAGRTEVEDLLDYWFILIDLKNSKIQFMAIPKELPPRVVPPWAQPDSGFIMVLRLAVRPEGEPVPASLQREDLHLVHE